MLRLKAVGPNSTKSLSVSNEINFKQLKNVIVEAFHEQSFKPMDFDVLFGFPPEVCTLSDEDPICPTLTTGLTLRISIKSAISPSSSSSHIPPNDAIRKRKVLSKVPSVVVGTKNQVSVLRTLDSSTKSFSVIGKSASTPIKNRSPRVRKLKVSDCASSENDIIEHLIEAVNGGKGSRNKILRKVFRSAVSNQYNTTKAVARLSSLYAGTQNHHILIYACFIVLDTLIRQVFNQRK